MDRVQIHGLKAKQEIIAQGVIWFLVILFLSSPSIPLLNGLWENQDLYSIFENLCENEERNENQLPEKDEREKNSTELILFTDLEVFSFQDIMSNMNRSEGWLYSTISPDIQTPPPKFKVLTTS